MGSSQADIVAGMMAFRAFYSHAGAEPIGRGQKIDLSMLDCQVAMLTYQAGIYFTTGQSPTRMGNQHPTITPYETYRCQDGYLNLACGNDGTWRAFCKGLAESWANDERFRTNAERVQNRRALSSLIEPVMLEKTTQEWIELLRAAGIPCGKIQSVGEICEDPQIIARDMVVTVEHPKAGAMRVTGVPVKLSDTPGAVTLHRRCSVSTRLRYSTEWLADVGSRGGSPAAGWRVMKLGRCVSGMYPQGVGDESTCVFLF